MSNLKVLIPQETVNQHFDLPEVVGKITYSESSDIWAFAEKKDFCVLVVSMSFIQNGNHSLIPAIRAIHGQMVVCLVQDIDDISKLVDIVNQCGAIRICRKEEISKSVSAAVTDSILVAMENDRKDKLIASLTLENEQYEFMLRHSLLS
ncbi:MAG: hypothetical protein GC193_05500 [Cryomorphaceae bacterium]|nr:hypothetical protein [Cryomorphaceae bacterium]